MSSLRRSPAPSTLLAYASDVFAAAPDPESIHGTIAKLAVPAFADACVVLRVSDDGALRQVATAAARADQERRIACSARLPIAADALVARALSQGRSRIAADLISRRTILLADEEDFGPPTPVSAVAVPMIARGALLGAVLFLSTADSGRFLGESDLPLAEELTRRAAVSLDNARLLEEARATATRLLNMQRVGAAVALARTPREVAAAALPHVAAAVNAASAALWMVDGESRRLDLLDSHGWPERFRAPGQRAPLDLDVPLAECARDGQPRWYSGAEDVSRILATLAPGLVLLGPQTGFGLIPLVTESRTVGVLAVSRRGTRLEEDDRSLLLALAAQCATALDRARLLEDLRDAVRLRDEFLSIAAHELRTPLSTIQLSIGSALKAHERSAEILPERAHQRLQRAGDQVRKLAELLERLLDVSRITAGRLVLSLEETDLAATLRDLVGRHEDPAARVALEGAENPVRGTWDRLRLEQAVTNLLSNAIKYGEGKPVHVRLSADDNEATIEVRDRGIGIAHDDRSRIFGRFERAVSPRNFGGFGVGLWITREIVEAMHGRIELESGVGEGSTFRIVLPREALA